MWYASRKSLIREFFSRKIWRPLATRRTVIILLTVKSDSVPRKWRNKNRKGFTPCTCNAEEASHINHEKWKTVCAKQTTRCSRLVWTPLPTTNEPENLVSRHYFRSCFSKSPCGLRKQDVLCPTCHTILFRSNCRQTVKNLHNTEQMCV